MKSIKQQYIDLTEGKMSQFNFMRNLRMTMPQYVTNVTSFNDAVKILKNKGILTEAKTKLTADQVNNDELRMGIRVEMEHTDDPEKAKKIALDHLAENPFYYTQLKLSGVDTKATPSKEKKAIAKKKDETEMVDKKNQMKTPKGVEKIKASANKAKKETNKPEKGIKLMSLVAKSTRGVKKMDATGEKMKKIKEGMEDFVDDRDYDNMDAEYGILRQIAMDAPDYASAMAELEDYGVDPQVAKSIASEIHPEKPNVAKTIFDRNANITRGEDPMARLKEAIRKMIRQEMFDGRDNMTDTVGKQLDEITNEDIVKKYNEMFGKNPQTKFADVAKALNIPEDQVGLALQSQGMPKFESKLFK
jgi:hypothetical protein